MLLGAKHDACGPLVLGGRLGGGGLARGAGEGRLVGGVFTHGGDGPKEEDFSAR